MTQADASENRPYLRFEHALPHQVREMIADRPIAYVPLGALEWHGEHAALGLDGVKAAWICGQAARRTGGVVFPALHWGAFNTVPFPFTFHFPKRAMKIQVRRILAALAQWGFRSIVCLTGHYPLAQITLVRKECLRISHEHLIGAIGIPEQAFALHLGYLGDHAAKWETSLLMAIDPALVDLSRLPADTGSLNARAKKLGILGICPKKHADAELGRRALEAIVTGVADVASRMLDEGNCCAAEEVYEKYNDAFRKPFDAARIAFGTNSKFEIIRFVIGNFLRQRHL